VAKVAAAHEEAVVSHTIPTQHPAVVLRSHYTHLRTLLAVAMIAVLGLTVAVVVLAVNDDGTGANSAQPLAAPPQAPTVPRFDTGRPEEGTRGELVTPSSRFDNGRPEEGTRGPGH
jgi:hypothetical protein